MNCSRCDVKAPEKLRTIGNEWLCPDCTAVPTKIIDVLKILYNSGVPGRYAYISEFTNNLDKVKNAFIERQALNNPYCTIYLSLPDGARHLQGRFDTIFVDRGFMTVNEILSLNLLDEFGEITWVDPTSQEIDRDRY